MRPEVRSGVLVRTSGNLPAGAGLSSSAAVLVAGLAALDSAVGSHRSRRHLVEDAFQIEKEWLHKIVGKMDFVACSEGGVTAVTADDHSFRFRRLSWPSNARLLLADTRVRRDTGDVNARKHRRAETGDELLASYVGVTRRAAATIAEALDRGSSNAALVVGAAMTRAHTALRDLMQSSIPLADKCVDRAVAGGAYGAKLSGAGGGGHVVVLCNASRVSRLKTMLVGLGCDVAEVEVAQSGLVVQKPRCDDHAET